MSCLAPLDVPDVIAGMSRRNRWSLQLVGRLGVLRRVLMARMAVSVRRRPDRVLERGVGAAVDKRTWAGRTCERSWWRACLHFVDRLPEILAAVCP